MSALPAPSRPTSALPDWLEAALAQADGAALLIARHAYRLRAVRIDQPLLLLPLAGTKRVRAPEAQLEIAPGRYLLVHGAQSLEVENLPAPDGTPYRAWAVALPWHVVALTRTLLAAHPQAAAGIAETNDLGSGELGPLLPALQHLLATLATAVAPDPAITDHALLGVALALVRAGHSRFLHAHSPSLAARIRLLVAEQPARDWVSADFEQWLHLSGATLRRRLSEERTSLRALLREARLLHGLGLLQGGSRRPLKAIALACGYRSTASFCRNFTEHFGIAPGLVAAGTP